MTARRLLAAVCWTAAAAVSAPGITGTYHAAASRSWLRRNRPTSGTDRPQVLMVVPALREQRVLADTVAYLTKLAEEWGPATVVLATTEREHVQRQAATVRLPEVAEALRRHQSVRQLSDRFAGVLPAHVLADLAEASGRPNVNYPAIVQAAFDEVPTTPALASKVAADSGGRVRHHHVVDPAAAMVQQINAAVHAELARLDSENVDPQQVWIGVYNADSRPHPDTLHALLALPADTQVAQQSALFIADPAAGRAGMWAEGAALLQSRWTLAREIPRLRAQARQARRRPNARWPRLAHCVGHGLFVRGDLWRQVDGLPSATMNEDLAFGYMLSAARVPIEPLPLIEHADSPDTIRAVFRQARQWFWSYPQYPAAAALAQRSGLGSRRDRAWLTVQGLARGGAWMGQSPAVAATLLLPLASRRHGVGLAVAGAALATYLAVPAAIAAAQRGKAGTRGRLRWRDLAGVTGAALVSSTGPWWCMADFGRDQLSGDVREHDKTER